MEEEENDKLDHYVEIGAVEVAGISEDGQFIYAITPLAKDLAPELWEAHEKHVNESLLSLYDMGLVSVSYDEDLVATIELTEEGKEAAKEFGIIQMDTGDVPND
jgi:hypothetical protein